MEKNWLISQLKQADLFSQLDTSELEKLAAIARDRRLESGDILFSAGDRARGFYVLLEGKIKLYKISADGKEYILRVVGGGQTFAEAAALSGLAYPVFAESMSQCRLVYFDASEFRSLIQQSPQLALNMIATMALLLQSLNQKIEDLSLREVAARLGRHLLAQARKQQGEASDGVTFQLETTKSALAARLGTISETLSRTFKKLQQREIVKVERENVTLLDCGQLEQIADGDLKL